MNEMRSLITDTAGRLFGDLCDKALIDGAEAGTWPADLWTTLEETGLTLAAVAEERGGGGGDLGDAMAILFQAGRHAAPVPLADTALAGWALAASGQAVPTGPLTVAADGLALTRGEGGWRLSGTATKVPWARDAGRIVVLADGGNATHVAMVDPAACTVEAGTNLAGEPRDTVTCADVALDESDVVEATDGVDADALMRLGALGRAALMAGALERIAEMAMEYALVRVQFGRPIAKFQAIQQQLAALAGEVAASQRAVDQAVAAAEAGDGALEIAVAKARVGESVGVSAEIAHQVHGAIGFTHEHNLHHFTRRLWSWRDEFGPEVYWQTAIGRRVVAAGADGLWPMLSGT